MTAPKKGGRCAPASRSVLAAVTAAAELRARADREYRTAIVDAVRVLEAAGVHGVYGKVAAAAGVSRQAVRELALRASTSG